MYATPVRVIGQNGGGTSNNGTATLGHDSYEHQQIPYPDYAPSVRSGARSLKGKPTNSTGTTRQTNLSGHHSLHYPSYAMVTALLFQSFHYQLLIQLPFLI